MDYRLVKKLKDAVLAWYEDSDHRASDHQYPDIGCFPTLTGSTPKEAVAKFLLALNKK